jgi:ParB family chromosome partitioning protein
MLERDDLRAEVTRAKAAPARGMGRGLAAILSVSEPGSEGDELRELPVDLVAPNPNQPRTTFDEEALQALSARSPRTASCSPSSSGPSPAARSS